MAAADEAAVEKTATGKGGGAAEGVLGSTPRLGIAGKKSELTIPKMSPNDSPDSSQISVNLARTLTLNLTFSR